VKVFSVLSKVENNNLKVFLYLIIKLDKNKNNTSTLSQTFLNTKVYTLNKKINNKHLPSVKTKEKCWFHTKIYLIKNLMYERGR
jgi:hypothetical protein